MKPFILFFVVVQTLWFSVPVRSQEVPYRLDEIVVTASRSATTLAEAPANVTVITAEEIRKEGAQTLIDVFQREPGVFPQNLLGNPKTSNVDIRGYGEAAPQNVLFMVNGRRLNAIDLSGADLAQVPLDAVERIEIYRGPASALFGDNAAAGAVNIILKTGDGAPKVTATTTVGSYNFLKPEVMISGKQDRFSYLALASDLDMSGYRHNNDFRAKDLAGNFSFDVSNNLVLNLSTGLHTDDYGQPGALYWSSLRAGIVDPKDSTHPNDTASTLDNFFDLVPEVKLRDDVVLSLGTSYRDRHTASYYDFGYGTYSDTKSQLQTYGFTPKVVVSTPIVNMKSLFVIGTDCYRYPTTVNSSGLLPGPAQSTSDVEKRDFAYYANEKINPFRDLTLEAGYRNQRSTYDITYLDFVNPVLSQAGTPSYDREAYRFGANYSIFDKANAFVSYSKGFRFPTPDELVVIGFSPAPGVYVPTQINSALQPQTTKEFDAGIRWNPWHRVAGSVTYYLTKNTDEIFFNPLDVANENYPKTKRQGLESSLFINLTTGLTLNLSYSYTEATFDGGPFDGNRIPLVPRNKVGAKLSYAISNWNFSLASVYMGDRYAISDQANAHEQLPGYTIFDTSISYRWNKLTALFTVKNLTDKSYSQVGVYSPFVNDIALYPLPGRQFFLSLAYSFGEDQGSHLETMNAMKGR
ncbi:MAG TPA: TonB-dependent receptor [Syntrophorhabdales bacterium]|nr:TonB-dependent receptor [Syntrophorhabdales bacterium]